MIAASLVADPELSNRQHAERVGADHKTVGTVRDELEGSGEIPHFENRTDTLGRSAPATKPPRSSAEFGAVRLQLPREARSETVRSLRDAGLSTRAIAAATGVNDKTVRNDLAGGEFSPPAPAPIVGTDGKRYNATRPTVLDAIDDPGEADAIVDLLEEHYGDDLSGLRHPRCG